LSTEKSEESFGVVPPHPLLVDRNNILPGSMNDASVIRGLITEVIRVSGKSRAQIAEEMSYLVGREVTERMLNGFTAESKDDYRWPAELDRAFCTVTGDTRLLTCRVELFGLYVIGDEEMELLELGMAFHQKATAEAKIEMLQKRLSGRLL
jgi:hypothetical protein